MFILRQDEETKITHINKGNRPQHFIFKLTLCMREYFVTL